MQNKLPPCKQKTLFQSWGPILRSLSSMTNWLWLQVRTVVSLEALRLLKGHQQSPSMLCSQNQVEKERGKGLMRPTSHGQSRRIYLGQDSVMSCKGCSWCFKPIWKISSSPSPPSSLQQVCHSFPIQNGLTSSLAQWLTSTTLFLEPLQCQVTIAKPRLSEESSSSSGPQKPSNKSRLWVIGSLPGVCTLKLQHFLFPHRKSKLDLYDAETLSLFVATLSSPNSHSHTHSLDKAIWVQVNKWHDLLFTDNAKFEDFHLCWLNPIRARVKARIGVRMHVTDGTGECVVWRPPNANTPLSHSDLAL